MQQFMKEFGSRNSIRFFYQPDWINSVAIEKEYVNEQLGVVLHELLDGSDIEFVEMYSDMVILFKKTDHTMKINELIYLARQAQKKINHLVVGDSSRLRLGEVVLVNGLVLESRGNTPVNHAVVSVDGNDNNVITDVNGGFALSLKNGEHVLLVKHVNYEDQMLYLRIFSKDSLRIILEDQPIMLNEVVVSDQSISNSMVSTIGQTSINIKELKKMPVLFGEVDIVKQVQTLPGVSSSGDASSGFYVRGGGADQNLVLYDGLPVFNTSHSFGFFSAFNAECVKDVTFYKGGIPSEFGGRVSSVLDVTAKEGDMERWKGKAGVGPISAQLQFEGPLKKKVSSISASLRSSYSDWVVKRFASGLKSIANSSVSFYDANFKWIARLSSQDKVALSVYHSSDNFRMPSDTAISWQSSLANLRYDHAFNSNLFFKLTLGAGQFKYAVQDFDPNTAYKLYYQINYPSVLSDIQWHAGIHKLGIGIASRLYDMQPGRMVSLSESIQSKVIQPQRSIESALFVSDEIKLSKKTSIQAGLRYSLYSSLGPAKVYYYDPIKPISVSSTIDSALFTTNKPVINYHGLEPRLSFNYTINSNTTIKGGYNRMFQYLHLISNSLSVAPIDVWQSSNLYFRPQIGDQVSVGYFRTFKENVIQASAEVYYKKIKNILDFKDGSDLILNPRLETALLVGKSQNYGIEFSASKSKGRFQGNVNYTFARSFRQISTRFPEENINHGKKYPSNFDQPHILNLNWKYSLSQRYFFTGNFTYRTGKPVTLPLSFTTIDGVSLANYSSRNEYRIPDYHRLDLGFVIEGNHRRKKTFNGTWIISIINVYARKNPFTVFYRKNEFNVQRAYKMSIIGSAIPSVTFNLTFNDER